MQPENQKYRLRIVSSDGAVEGPELTFEEAAKMLVTFHEEGLGSVESWTLDRPATPDEISALIKRATEINQARHCPRCGGRYGGGTGHGPGFCKSRDDG